MWCVRRPCGILVKSTLKGVGKLDLSSKVKKRECSLGKHLKLIIQKAFALCLRF